MGSALLSMNLTTGDSGVPLPAGEDPHAVSVSAATRIITTRVARTMRRPRANALCRAVTFTTAPLGDLWVVWARPKSCLRGLPFGVSDLHVVELLRFLRRNNHRRQADDEQLGLDVCREIESLRALDLKGGQPLDRRGPAGAPAGEHDDQPPSARFGRRPAGLGPQS